MADGSAGTSVAKYVGYKISRVRWKPQPSGAIRPSDVFVAGSWDDKVNRVAVWRYDPSAPPSPPSSPSAPYPSEEGFVEPARVCEVGVEGDVMDLRFVDEERMAVGLSSGSVALLHFRAPQKTITRSRQWDRIHYITTRLQPRPVTAVATSGLTIATGGEDGRINILHPENSAPLRTIENADNAVVTGLVSTMKTELLATSSSGQLKLWDLRAPSVETPSRIMVM
ncbi:Nucleoporin Nup43 [Geodia barretti]|uniref:Nucleoporin Nup43 n=1 Tax=Geodia barretti TaxID=519541 RepID=A0AA35WGW9_GEOBA|nr:Nucleoporin Nup43 [Geodia barretti]